MRTKVCYVLNILGISTMFVSFVSGAQDCVMAPTQVSVYLNRWESFLHNPKKNYSCSLTAPTTSIRMRTQIWACCACTCRRWQGALCANSVNPYVLTWSIFFSYVFFCSYSPTSCQIQYHLPREGPRDRCAIHSRFWRTCADRPRVRIYYVSANNHSTGVCFDV